MGAQEVFSIEKALQQHKDETAAEIRLVSNSIHALNQKTDVILEELRKLTRGRIESALQQHKEVTDAQIQVLRDSIHVVDQKTDLILEEFQQQCMSPIDVEEEIMIQQHKKETLTQIQLSMDHVQVVDQKTDYVVEELQQCTSPIEVEGELIQQQKKETSAQIQLSTDSVHSVEQKTGLILEELQQRISPIDVEGELIQQHKKETVAHRFWGNHKDYDSEMSEMESVNADGQDLFTSCDKIREFYDAMHLQVLRDNYAYGFEKPSSIQQRKIEPCKGQAESRTGKTATICSPCLQKLYYSDRVECQALVHSPAPAPTRELAQQIEKAMRAFGHYVSVNIHSCVGETSGIILPVHAINVSDLIPIAHQSRTRKETRNLQHLDYALTDGTLQLLDSDLLDACVPKVCKKKLITPKGPKKPKKSEFRVEFSRRSKKSSISWNPHLKMHK